MWRIREKNYVYKHLFLRRATSKKRSRLQWRIRHLTTPYVENTPYWCKRWNTPRLVHKYCRMSKHVYSSRFHLPIYTVYTYPSGAGNSVYSESQNTWILQCGHHFVLEAEQIDPKINESVRSKWPLQIVGQVTICHHKEGIRYPIWTELMVGWMVCIQKCSWWYVWCTYHHIDTIPTC